MKSNYITKGLLVFLIALSLFLTWLIWTSPSQYDERVNTNTTSTSGVTFSRQLFQVYGPSQLAVYEASSETINVTTSNEALTPLMRLFENWELSDLSDSVVLSNQSYQQNLAQTDTIEMIFSETVTFGLFHDVFDQLSEDDQERTFDRMYIPLDDPVHVYFFDTEQQLLYSSEATNVNAEELTEIVENEEIQYYSASAYSIGTNEHFFYAPDEEITLPILSYLVEKQPNSLFIERLFDDTSEVRETVRTDTNVEYINYADGSAMEIDENTNILNFSRNRSSGENLTITKRLEESFDELIKYENWPDNVQFFDYNNRTNDVTYRRYISGYPVFGSESVDYGTTTINVVQNGLTELQVPLTVAQTPISEYDESQVTLQSWDELLLSLSENGYSLESVEDIKIGYTWTGSLESSRVIELQPEWYVKIGGSWSSFDAITERGESGGL